jgi:hypothetical protein
MYASAWGRQGCYSSIAFDGAAEKGEVPRRVRVVLLILPPAPSLREGETDEERADGIDGSCPLGLG